jgi:uncharacterized protein (TIGR02301 family)
MRRSVAPLALACASLLSFEAGAQGIFDNLFGPDRPERAAPRSAPARDVPQKEKKRPDAAAAKAKKKGEPAKGQPETAAKPGAPGGEAPPPPYEGQLMRLSEVLGALAFLRDLCQAKDGGDWRDKMSALLEAEAPSGPRRDKYVAAFNRGFRGYELTYRVCTQNAKDATARYLDEAAKISRDVSYRFGSP